MEDLNLLKELIGQRFESIEAFKVKLKELGFDEDEGAEIVIHQYRATKPHVSRRLYVTVMADDSYVVQSIRIG